jgi:DNA (cytosine-5)-methyltransferase 1
MVKYSCERCGKYFSLKSHYISHNKSETHCKNISDKIKAPVDEKLKELNNKKMIANHEAKENKYTMEQHGNANEIKYIDLCSGIGGFRIALESIDNIHSTCVLSADIKQDAIDTYNLNFNENNQIIDIYTLKNEDIKPFDLLCAGFPCQPFSSAGQKKGFSDKRGGMIFKIIDICKYHKPRFVVLENVYNLMTLENGNCIKKIRQLFEDIGYNVNYKKLNSSNFGCAQSRERVYIVCTRDTSFNFEDIIYKPNVNLNSIIDYANKDTEIDPTFSNKILQLHKESPIFGCKIGDKRGGKNNIHSWDIGFNGYLTKDEKELMNTIMLNRRKKHWAEKKQIVWMDGMPLTYEEIMTFYENNNLKNMLANLVDMKYLRLEKPKDLVDGKRKYKEELPEGYNICKGKLSFPISKILDPNYISPTLTATDSHKLAVIIDDNTIRNISSAEMKKICGFPDLFIIPEHVNYGDLFGNMATPPVIKEIFEILLK